MERERFNRLKKLNELDARDITMLLEEEIGEYECEADGQPDDYVMNDCICPKHRAMFLQRIVDLINSLNTKSKKDDAYIEYLQRKLNNAKITYRASLDEKKEAKND